MKDNKDNISNYESIQFIMAEKEYKVTKLTNTIFWLSIVIWLCMALSNLAYSQTSLFKKPFQIEQVWVEYKEIQSLRDPYYPENKDDDWTRSAEFHWKTSILKRLYWDNNFHFRMDLSQVRHVGWEYYLGLKLTDWLDVIKYHHSQHCAECENTSRKFPVEDSYGIRFYFKK